MVLRFYRVTNHFRYERKEKILYFQALCTIVQYFFNLWFFLSIEPTRALFHKRKQFEFDFEIADIFEFEI
jgi:hypothetical protein